MIAAYRRWRLRREYLRRWHTAKAIEVGTQELQQSVDRLRMTLDSYAEQSMSDRALFRRAARSVARIKQLYEWELTHEQDEKPVGKKQEPSA